MNIGATGSEGAPNGGSGSRLTVVGRRIWRRALGLLRHGFAVGCAQDGTHSDSGVDIGSSFGGT